LPKKGPLDKIGDPVPKKDAPPLDKMGDPIPKKDGLLGLPVGIPDYTTVKDKVAAGRRPPRDEGLDWLRAHGYKTVLSLRAPGEDDNADRRQIEKHGLKYLSLEVSPLTMSRELVDTFNRLIADSSSYPLFVCDKEGALTGALWYMHFRTVETL